MNSGQTGSRGFVCLGNTGLDGLFFARKLSVILRLHRGGFSSLQRKLMPPGHLGVGVHGPSALEDSGKTVVIRRIDRIEFVVMAPRTSEGHPHEHPAHSVNLLVDDIHPHLWLVHFRQNLGTNRKKSRRHLTLVAFGIGPDIQKVASDLFDDEAIKWLV